MSQTLTTTNEETTSMNSERDRAAVKYAAKFYAETWGAEPRAPKAPTDANLREHLCACALPVPSSMLSAIRYVLLSEYGVRVI